MTPQERDLLDRFLSDLAQARPGPKDADAAGRIDQTLRANPDAAYVLVQHAILADQSLAQAQARIQELQQQGGPSPSQGGGFLGRGQQAGYGQQGGYGQGGGYPQQGGGYPPPQATAAPPSGGGLFGGGGGPGPFSGGGGLGGFLRSAGTAAAGVAGGAFLFEGLSGMFGGHHGGGFGGGFGGGGETIINEYGDDRSGGGFGDGGGDYDGGGGSDFGDDNS